MNQTDVNGMSKNRVSLHVAERCDGEFKVKPVE